jgi:hypothetical protein
VTDLDDLYEAVSRAIADAEGMPDERSRDTAAAWLHVARLERAIAEQTAASTVSGEAARIGAIRAALQGRDVGLACELARLYVVDATLGERPRAELERLRSQAEADLATLTTCDPQILPVNAKIAA